MRLLAKCVAGCFIMTALALVVSSNATAQGEKAKAKPKVEAKVKVGDTAPSFTSVDENGKTFKSSDVVGKKVLVLYFYPADFTGGCTKQACGFRDDVEKLNSAGVQVVGVSGDTVETHKLFKAHHKLNFPLLADGKGEVAKLFGVPVTLGDKKATGKNEKGEDIVVVRTATILRWTVVIDKAGKIAAIDQIGDAAGDSKRVIEIVKKLDTK